MSKTRCDETDQDDLSYFQIFVIVFCARLSWKILLLFLQ